MVAIGYLMTMRRCMEFNQRMRSTERNSAPGVLTRAVRVLDTFDAATPHQSLSELVQRSGLPKTTVHRLVGELCELGLLERVGTGVYRLGIRLFELGELVPHSRSLAEAALPIMEDLREATRQRIHLAVLDGVDVLYVAILGATGTNMSSRTGGRLPAHATGVGKVLLAYSPAAVVKERIEAGLPRLTPRTICTPGDLDRELRSIRAEGMAYDREESHVGVSCVAAPIFGSDRKIRAALSITGRTRAIDPVRFGVAIRTAAFTLSRQSSFSPSS